ncbi:MAG: Mrp/NBP35 family ATP-binding protein [Oscillospiraceae bacterium]|nr:Mrp/NBP35 family ATP-binding protein [Oscillospiraceae bacterium]
MSECSHDCLSCSANCSERKPESFLKALNPRSSVKKVIAVVSGKGGVGKSLVTCLLTSEMQRRGYRCAVLDADITGPSVPKSFGITEHAMGTEEYLLPVTTESGLQIMSINLILENETEPVVWRGPVIAGAVTQFWTDVLWTDVDYMFVDMPPGTGDVPLTVFQSLPVDGVVIVTTPQNLVGMIVSKAVNMAGMMNVPVLGLVENMSYYVCPDCGKRHEIFGESQAERIAAEFDIPYTARIPIDPKITAMVDAGEIEKVDGGELAALADSLEKALPLKSES